MKHLFQANPLRTAGLFLIFFGIGFIVEYFDVDELHYLLRGVMVLSAAAALIILNRPLLDWIDRREIEHAQSNPTDRKFPMSLAVYIATALVIGLIVVLALAL